MHSMDRLSCLPDEIICHILSFLLTERYVQTSVLSKRWRFLWANVPVLEFDVYDIRTENIVSQFLLHHNHDIHTFRLNIDTEDLNDIDIEEFESLIVNITTRNVRNLIILVAAEHFSLHKIPCLFTSKTLVELCLSNCEGFPESGICFPALKKLKLAYAYESLALIVHLLSGCPVLEELSIDGWRMLGQCCISSLVLTRLVLRIDEDIWEDIWDGDDLLNFGMKLDTPILGYLKLYSFISDKFLIGSLDSLIEADICLYWDEDHQDHLVYWREVLAFVAKLYNVKVLKFSTDQAVESIHDPTFFGLANKFHNLTKLDLSVYSNLGLVAWFLENANNLRVLCLSNRRMVFVDNQYYYWMEPKQVPSCLISHLRTVELCYFRSYVPEYDMIKYILMNAKVLKRMKVCIRLNNRDWEEKFNVVKRLALFERGSQECQLVVD